MDEENPDPMGEMTPNNSAGALTGIAALQNYLDTQLAESNARLAAAYAPVEAQYAEMERRLREAAPSQSQRRQDLYGALAQALTAPSKTPGFGGRLYNISSALSGLNERYQEGDEAYRAGLMDLQMRRAQAAYEQAEQQENQRRALLEQLTERYRKAYELQYDPYSRQYVYPGSREFGISPGSVPILEGPTEGLPVVTSVEQFNAIGEGVPFIYNGEIRVKPRTN